jgi:deoxyribose-phosphate aldolase
MIDIRRTLALRAIPCLDLTDLSETTTVEATDQLCAHAVRPIHGEEDLSVAAVCVWPRFVARCKANLAGGRVKIATVANFPSGRETFPAVAGTVDAALDAGADGIDLVLDHVAFRAGEVRQAGALIEQVRNGLPRHVRLKVILETGELGHAETIRGAARLAVAAGADFLKTSTGKVPRGATLEAARVLFEVARESTNTIGVKISGGVRTTDDAAAYLSLADEIMGPGWAAPSTFRFGASSLLNDLAATVGGHAADRPGTGY